MLWLKSSFNISIGSGAYIPFDMILKINNMSTDMCVNISTIYDDNPINMDETFIISLSSNDPKVFIPEGRAVTIVTIENSKFTVLIISLVSLIFSLLVPSPDVEPMINKVTEGMDAIFTLKFSHAIASNGFQWQLDEEDIIGEHARMTSLTIINVTEMNEGNYTCILMFSLFQGYIKSKGAELLVCKLSITIA